jgi:hypothetical protein
MVAQRVVETVEESRHGQGKRPRRKVRGAGRSLRLPQMRCQVPGFIITVTFERHRNYEPGHLVIRMGLEFLCQTSLDAGGYQSAHRSS